MFYFANENAEQARLKSLASWIVIELLRNMLDVSIIRHTLYYMYIFKATPPFADTSAKERLT